MKKNKKIISLLILMLMIVGVFATDKLSVFAEINDKDFDMCLIYHQQFLP